MTVAELLFSAKFVQLFLSTSIFSKVEFGFAKFQKKNEKKKRVFPLQKDNVSNQSNNDSGLKQRFFSELRGV